MESSSDLGPILSERQPELEAAPFLAGFDTIGGQVPQQQQQAPIFSAPPQQQQQLSVQEQEDALAASMMAAFDDASTKQQQQQDEDALALGAMAAFDNIGSQQQNHHHHQTQQFSSLLLPDIPLIPIAPIEQQNVALFEQPVYNTNDVNRPQYFRDICLLANDAVAYSSRPQFRSVVTADGGFFVRVCLGPVSESEPHNMKYRAARILGVDMIPGTYKARGLLTDVELIIDAIPGARIRLTAISNQPITEEEFKEYCSTTAANNGFPSKIYDDSELATLASKLKATWNTRMLYYVLNTKEQGEIVERNEKLKRARRNLAGEVNSYVSKIELTIQQQQRAAAIQQQQSQGVENNNMMMMGQPQVSTVSESEDAALQIDLQAVDPTLIDELMRANSRFSDYIKNSTSTISKLAYLTDRNRRRNEQINLRGETIRAVRDAAIRAQEEQAGAQAATTEDNIWTLDSDVRSDLAKAFNEKIPRDATNDPKIEDQSASDDYKLKPKRITEQAIKEAVIRRSPTEVNSILSKFSSADFMNRLLNDATAATSSSSPRGSSSSASPMNNNNNSQRSNNNNGSSFSSQSSSSTTQTFSQTQSNNVFSIPRRRVRQEIQQNSFENEIASNNVPMPQQTNGSLSSMLMVPQNSGSF